MIPILLSNAISQVAKFRLKEHMVSIWLLKMMVESNGKLNANRARIGPWEKFEVTCNESKPELSSILRTFEFNSYLFSLQITSRSRQNV